MLNVGSCRLCSIDPFGKAAFIRGKLSGFKDRATARLITQLNEVDAASEWTSQMSTTDRMAVAQTLNIVADNMDKLKDAKEDPAGAIMGVLNILGGLASLVGSGGQMASIVLRFIASFVGLFGNSKEEKNVGEIVHGEIDNALSEFRDEILLDQAAGVAGMFKVSKIFLDALVESGTVMGPVELAAINRNVPVTESVDFMAVLENRIRTLIQTTDGQDAKKCIKYIELYARLAVTKDALLAQTAALIPNTNLVLRNAIFAVQRGLRETAKSLFQFLYSSDPDQKVLAYYNVDTSVVTDGYAINVLGISDYDRALKGMRSISVSIMQKDYLDWKTNINLLPGIRTGVPYITSSTNHQAIWQFRPHGNNLFIIVNKRTCTDETPGEWCDAFLSWEEFRGEVRAKLSKDNPVMWQVQMSPTNPSLKM